jgi:hypothetical protein
VNPSDADRYLERILVNAHTTLARYHAAIGHLRDSTGEYRATASGAGPATCNGDGSIDPDADVALTAVEAAANAHLTGRPDKALTALAWIDDDLRKADHHLTNLTRHITANWIPGSQAAAEADAITRRIDDLWCSNHRRHGTWEPRQPDNPLCIWCADTRKPVKAGGCGHLPDAELIEARHRRGRLTTRDYDQFMNRNRSQTAAERAARRRKGAA